jgi:hypothetical protein
MVGWPQEVGKMAIQKIGGLWRPKNSKNQDVVATGYIWAPGKVRIVVMKPKYAKKHENAPDLNILVFDDDEPRKKEESGGGEFFGASNSEDVPF